MTSNSQADSVETSNTRALKLYSLGAFIGITLVVIGLYKNPHILFDGAWGGPEERIKLTLFGVSFGLLHFLFSIIFRSYSGLTTLALMLAAPLIFISASVGIQSWIIPSIMLFSSLCLGRLIIKLAEHILGHGAAPSSMLTSISPREGIFTADSLLNRKILLIDTLLSLLLGLGTYMLILGVMVHFPVNYSWTYLGLLFVPPILNGKEALTHLRSIFKASHTDRQSKSIFELVLYSLIATILMVHTVQVCRPEMMMDALGIHLLVPDYIKTRHYWSFNVEQFVFAVMPMGADWLYSMAHILADEYAIRVLNFSFLLLGTLMIAAFFLHSERRITSLLTTALYLSSPLLFVETGSLFVDNLWALLLLGSFAATYRFISTQHLLSLLIAGALSGAALSIKVTSIFFIAPVLLIVAVSAYMQRRMEASSKGIFRYLTAALFFGAILGMYPYIYAWISTQNPVFPFYNAIFKSPLYYSAESFKQPTYVLPFTLKSLYNMTFKSSIHLEAIDGALGLQFLAFLPLTILVTALSRSRFVIGAFIIAWGYFLLVCPFQAYLRYLLPSFVLQSVLIGYAFWTLECKKQKYLFALSPTILIIITLNIWSAPAGLWLYRSFPVYETFIGKQEDELRSKVPQRILISALNTIYGADTRVLSLDQNSANAAGLEGEAFINAWYNDRIYRLMQQINSPEDILAVVKEYNISHMMTGYEPWVLPPIREFLAKNATIEFSVGQALVYRLNKDNLPRIELLKNSSLTHPLEPHWTLEGDVLNNFSKEDLDKGAIIGQGKRIYQVAKITPGETYKLKIRARKLKALGESPGDSLRLQANWISGDGTLLSFYIHPVNCSEEYREYAQEFKAPENADSAIIYVGPHTPNDDGLEVQEVSFSK